MTAALSPTTSATEADSLTVLALQIAAGDLSGLPKHEHILFEHADWASAADELLHESNPFELAWMLRREAAYQDFKRWEAQDYERRQYSDFGTWLDDRDQWNRSYPQERKVA